jgi:hypothetical protein
MSLTEIDCPTCEGQGELSDEPVLHHCPAYGEPLKDGQIWCDEHKCQATITLSGRDNYFVRF